MLLNVSHLLMGRPSKALAAVSCGPFSPLAVITGAAGRTGVPGDPKSASSESWISPQPPKFCWISRRNFRYACAPETVYDFVWKRAEKLSFERVSSTVHVKPSFEPRRRQARGSRSGESFAEEMLYEPSTYASLFGASYWRKPWPAKMSHFVPTSSSKAFSSRSFAGES
ncbi:hypothetical protein [Sorangium sp. So ce1153]|uniref:hypothetical protein n=1 Tax=Sorangium sp. So ce1153 TaxID=3133333 RepID=UPI003F6442BB